MVDQDSTPLHLFTRPLSNCGQNAGISFLFKLKPGVSQEQIDGFCEAGKQMVGKIPGLRDFQVGPALAITAHRAKGFDMGVVAILENVADITGYGPHPAHREVHELREQITEDTLAFDMQF